jgi:hypothetical protein
MKTRSAKAKGKRLVVHVKERLLHYAPQLQPDDLMIPTTSVPGEDLWLSPAAKAIYPISVEAKNCETAKVWEWIAQAQANCLDRKPVVIFSRNRATPHVLLSLEHFLELIRPKPPTSSP